nr:colipase-like protein 2 isoform X3 [Symphalangus syndactylus]
MAASLALVAGVLAGAVLPLWSALPQYKKVSRGARPARRDRRRGWPRRRGSGARRRRAALKGETKGATNIICPCRMGLRCISRDLMCVHRCHMI